MNSSFCASGYDIESFDTGCLRVHTADGVEISFVTSHACPVNVDPLDSKLDDPQEREQLLTDIDALEKFAREKYLMKKESEDLFVITDK